MSRFRAGVGAAITALACLATPVVGEDAELPLRIESLGDGVWAALQPAEGRFNDSNSLVVATSRGLVVVDSQASLDTTAALIDEMVERTGLPVRYLVNTHWHNDHTHGNQVYADRFPDLEILGASSVPSEMVDRGAPQRLEEIEAWEAAIVAAEERLEQGIDRHGDPLPEARRPEARARVDGAREHVAGLRAVRPTPPTMTFTGELEIGDEERRVRLIAIRAHTRGDVIVHLPDLGIVATGDVVDDLPYGGHGYPVSWLAAMEVLERLDAEVVVPGHGPVLDADLALGRVTDLLRSTVSAARAGVEAGQEVDEIVAGYDASALRSRFVSEGDEAAARAFDQFVPTFVEQAVAELREPDS